jgi:SAM-dependent methyltransferase
MISAGAPLNAYAKRLMRRSRVLTCAAYMAHDAYVGHRLRRGEIDTESGTFSRGNDPGAVADRILKYHRLYLKTARCDRFAGRVAELGPGDNYGMALVLRAAGAIEWHGVDRFRPTRDPAHAAAVHHELAQRLGRPDLLRNNGGRIDGTTDHAGAAAETFFRTSGLTFDVILSGAVLEHCENPLVALDGMLAALRPGGIMVHIVDLRDHGLFEGQPPLTFLTVPDRIYRRMVRNSGRPNRFMFADYRTWAKQAGVECELEVYGITGPERDFYPDRPEERAAALAAVRAVRSRLARSMSAHSDSDLAVSGFSLIVRKPR